MKAPLNQEYMMRTISSILVVAAAIGMVTIVWFFNDIVAVFSTMAGILTPFLLGCVIAFILTPTVTRVERIFHHHLFNKPRPRLARAIGIVVAYVAMILAVVAFMYLLVPQLVQSLQSVVSYISTYWMQHSSEINALINEFAAATGSPESENLASTLNSLLSKSVSQLLSYSNVLVSNVLSISASVSNFVVQIFIALCAGVYLLIEKEHFAAQSKKILCAFMPTSLVKLIVKWTRRCHRIFAGFINGKLLDSLIIGILCYLTMVVLKMDYALLISVVIGITNVLPFFGPFIGAIPSIIILLIIDPFQALEFGIMILVLQQIDGNIIGPRVLGNSLGLSPFWIMLSIIVGSGLFGFIGILLGVPVFALIYAIVQAVVEYRLSLRGLPTETKAYRGDAVIDRRNPITKEH